MLKILLIIPSGTSQKFTHYSYFIPMSLFIIPILFFFFMILCIDIQRNMDLMHILFYSYCVHVSNVIQVK